MFEDDEDNGHKTFLQSPPSPEAVAYLAKWNRPAWVPLYTSPPEQRKPLTDEAKAVIDTARAAMDDSVEAYDSEGSIKISSHLAASLSLCLDEYDRAIEAAHGIRAAA